jgi:hypothetical protein
MVNFENVFGRERTNVTKIKYDGAFLEKKGNEQPRIITRAID